MAKKRSKILLTRSFEENSVIKEQLRGMDVDIFECPLIQYELLDLPNIPSSVELVIITSKFLAKNLPPLPAKIKILVVGESSAAILQKKGFEIEFIAKSAEHLKEYILDNNLQTNKILYLCSDHITTEMPDDVHSEVMYKVRYLHEFSQEELGYVSAGLDYVMLYSENSAKTFCRLIEKYNLQKRLKDIMIISMSEKVGEVVKNLAKDFVYQPNNQEMINYLKLSICKKPTLISKSKVIVTS